MVGNFRYRAFSFFCKAAAIVSFLLLGGPSHGQTSEKLSCPPNGIQLDFLRTIWMLTEFQFVQLKGGNNRVPKLVHREELWLGDLDLAEFAKKHAGDAFMLLGIWERDAEEEGEALSKGIPVRLMFLRLEDVDLERTQDCNRHSP